MRISDWSSDVCSSDLGLAEDGAARIPRQLAGIAAFKYHLRSQPTHSRQYPLVPNGQPWQDRPHCGNDDFYAVLSPEEETLNLSIGISSCRERMSKYV